jgi:hypothetical protein
MAEKEVRVESVTRGRIEVWRREDGVWGVGFYPHQGDPDWPGVDYTPNDEKRPRDFPTEYDPEALLTWAPAAMERPAPGGLGAEWAQRPRSPERRKAPFSGAFP